MTSVGSCAPALRERFARASTLKKRADDSVAAGREFVEACVQFVHYAECLHADATTGAAHHAEAEKPSPAHQEHAH